MFRKLKILNTLFSETPCRNLKTAYNEPQSFNIKNKNIELKDFTFIKTVNYVENHNVFEVFFLFLSRFLELVKSLLQLAGLFTPCSL